MKFISSSQNSTYKILRDLKKRAVREELRLTFIEGIRFVTEAIEMNWPIKQLFFSNCFLKTEAYQKLKYAIQKLNPEPIVLSDSLFELASDTKNPQGILAVIHFFDCSLDTLLQNRTECVQFLIMDEIKDPGNAGTMIRTAEAAGFSGVILSEESVDIYSPKTLRATMGSIFRIPILCTDSLEKILPILKEKKVKLFGAALDAAINYFDCSFRGCDLAIIVGNEAFGIRDTVLEMCDERIFIPILGKAESLNASIAAALLIYEVIRQNCWDKN